METHAGQKNTHSTKLVVSIIFQGSDIARGACLLRSGLGKTDSSSLESILGDLKTDRGSLQRPDAPDA